MESKTLDFTGMKIPRDYNKGKEEKNNSKSSCNILGGASVHKRASYHMNFYIIANGN